jgi:hypothetical protein
VLDSINRTQERNRQWEEFQEARRERERRWEQEEREIDMLRQQEVASEAERASEDEASTTTPQAEVSAPAPMSVVPAARQASTATPQPVVVAPASITAVQESYSPPSLSGYLSDETKQFGKEVLIESASILAEQFAEGASDLRDAARGGIKGLADRTWDSLVDDLLDSGKDAVKDAGMNLMSEDRQVFIRALDVPLSILTRNWNSIEEAWNSLVDEHVKKPLDDFTVESIVKQAGDPWPSGSR